MDTSFPQRSRSGGARGDPEDHAAIAHHTDMAGGDDTAMAEQAGFSLPPPAFANRRRRQDPRVLQADQANWNLWGMMVGFMAAGAAILIILSLKGA